jgi:thymidylate synthase ThyX
MSYAAKIIADSVSPGGKRLTTMEITFPRIVLAEFNTHRMFSRNSASSRAIPIRKMMDKVLTDPFVPERFPRNGKGMQPDGYFESKSKEHKIALNHWLNCRNTMVRYVESLDADGVHKQIVNRLLEPWLWHTVIVTATEWANFFKLRTHTDAQEQIKTIADMMYDLYHNPPVEPRKVGFFAGTGGYTWHTPYVDDGEIEADTLRCQVSVARCARVSYLTHDGKRDIDADLELFGRLEHSGHWSPFEHVARPEETKHRSGNFIGWHQYRKDYIGRENAESFTKEA